jgi:hypothetical protein
MSRRHGSNGHCVVESDYGDAQPGGVRIMQVRSRVESVSVDITGDRQVGG